MLIGDSVATLAIAMIAGMNLVRGRAHAFELAVIAKSAVLAVS